MAFTRTPCGASSLASDLLSVISSPFAAAYGPAPGPPPFRPAIETTLMIAPLLRSTMDETTAREQRAALVRVRLRISFHVASSISTAFMRRTNGPALVISNRDVGSQFGKQQSRCRAYARRCAGNQCNFPG